MPNLQTDPIQNFVPVHIRNIKFLFLGGVNHCSFIYTVVWRNPVVWGEGGNTALWLVRKRVFMCPVRITRLWVPFQPITAPYFPLLLKPRNVAKRQCKLQWLTPPIFLKVQRDGFSGSMKSMTRKFTLSQKKSKHPSVSLFFWCFMQKHKTTYFKTSLIQISEVDTRCAKLLWKDRT